MTTGGCGGGNCSNVERSEHGARIPADACSDVEPNAHISIKPRVWGFALVDLRALCFEAGMTLEELRAECRRLCAEIDDAYRAGNLAYGVAQTIELMSVIQQIRDIQEREQQLANIRVIV